MCLANNFDGNKTLVCQVGDLTNGDQYRTPDEPGISLGDTMLVLCLPTDDISEQEGFTKVASLRTGVVIGVSNSIKLGRDRAGRLYASRYLNPVQPTAVVTPADAN
jgi:hypothetical protein